MSPVTACADPMVYTATVVTDVKLGTTVYHNAALSLIFRGDTNDISVVTDGSGNPIPSVNCPGSNSFYLLSIGTASAQIDARGKSLVAQLNPSQVFVALDSCNGGIGFGAFIGPGGLEPAYPLAFTLGTAISVSVNSGLSSPAHMSGNAWSCIGYPPTGDGNLPGTGYCVAPDGYPLHTDMGDLFVYQPYTVNLASDGSFLSNHTGSMNRGTFSIVPAMTHHHD
jgi:hypothetical protein